MLCGACICLGLAQSRSFDLQLCTTLTQPSACQTLDHVPHSSAEHRLDYLKAQAFKIHRTAVLVGDTHRDLTPSPCTLPCTSSYKYSILDETHRRAVLVGESGVDREAVVLNSLESSA